MIGGLFTLISKTDIQKKIDTAVVEIAEIIEQFNGSRIVTERKVQQISQSLWINIPKGITEFTLLKKGDIVQFIFAPRVSDETMILKIKKGDKK